VSGVFVVENNRGRVMTILKGLTMRNNLMLLATMALALSGVTKAAIHKGQVELEFLGGIAMESSSEGSNQDAVLAGETGADLDAWFLTGGISWFRTSNLQLGISGFGSWMDGSETVSIIPDPEDFPDVANVYDVDVDLMVYGVGGKAKWHFGPQNAMVPYIGIQANWATADIDIDGQAYMTSNGEVIDDTQVALSESDSASGILWGPILGLRIQLGQTDALLVEYQYHLWAGSIGDVLDNGHAIAIGLSHRLN
jgi:hypothetical protein